MDNTYYEDLRIECFNHSYDCSANRYIFEKRAERFKWRIKLLKTIGFIVPITVGLTAMGYELNSHFLQYLKFVAIPITIIQFIIAAWAVFYGWDDELFYAYQSIQSYIPLFNQFNELAKFPPTDFKELKKKYDLINKDYIFRDQQDSQHNVKQWESRMGMRYSLWLHQCECIGCKKTPLSIKSNDCDICGKFSFRYKLFNL